VKAKVVFKIYLNTFRIATMQQFGMLVGEETQWLPCTAVVAALKAQGAWRGLDPGVQQLLASAYAFLWTPDLAIPRVCGRGISGPSVRTCPSPLRLLTSFTTIRFSHLCFRPSL